MLPTTRLLFLSLAAGVLIASISLIPEMVYLAIVYIIAIIVLVVVDYLLTVRPTDIEAERINDAKLSIGAMNPITILVANRGNRTIQFQVRDEYPYQFTSNTPYLVGRVEPYAIYEACYRVLPLQRGVYHFGNINMRYLSNLKMFVRQVRYSAESEVRVYPNVLEVRKYDLLARKGLLRELGLRRSHLFGTGNEFERLREYTTDDEFRRINWKATARRGQPIAAEYETERSQHVMSMIDTGRLMHTQIESLTKLDHVINTVLLLSYVVALEGDHVGLMTFADDTRTYISPKRGKGQFHRLLEALYDVQAEHVEPNYEQAISYLGIKQKRRSLVVIFTDLVTLEAAKSLIISASQLSRRHLVLCVTISDPNTTRFIARSVVDSNSIYQRAVAETLLDERQVILDTLNRNGILTVDVPADKLTINVINTYLELKERGRL